ncbi:hypothetical protein BBW65_04635 [Helicobacter enhydrae]|uniref:Probable molybdenum cofactor guanylyltransferase n=1 Tax=Helicobacter enhydrae TaxID=222136 RepID=A0A1B1U5U4_9HELI|nr:molybdenum cofactor guanylyltransferase MobA [Helicobacter enhydrae]ANV98129.1 hypothetical protein BBW65_04635 [Helicobacter enhydrae]
MSNLQIQEIPCVILCGGKSSRMGVNKALLQFGHQTLVEYMYAKCHQLFAETYLVCKEHYGLLDPRVILEPQGIFAPLVGINTAFETLKSQKIFVISVDVPFFSIACCRDMFVFLEQYEIVFARSQGHSHYLCGFYDLAILPKLQAQLKQQNYRMSDLVSQTRHIGVFFDDEAMFANLNTPQDYQQALARIANG